MEYIFSGAGKGGKSITSKGFIGHAMLSFLAVWHFFDHCTFCDVIFTVFENLLENCYFPPKSSDDIFCRFLYTVICVKGHCPRLKKILVVDRNSYEIKKTLFSPLCRNKKLILSLFSPSRWWKKRKKKSWRCLFLAQKNIMKAFQKTVVVTR